MQIRRHCILVRLRSASTNSSRWSAVQPLVRLLMVVRVARFDHTCEGESDQPRRVQSTSTQNHRPREWCFLRRAPQTDARVGTLKGSFFTHYLVTAMLGAADMDRDGQVDLREAYQYAFENTIRASSRMISPAFNIRRIGTTCGAKAILSSRNGDNLKGERNFDFLVEMVGCFLRTTKTVRLSPKFQLRVHSDR
ncbi:MAG: hypothetical protein R3A47_03760 [Polyangiales bacterium]